MCASPAHLNKRRPLGVAVSAPTDINGESFAGHSYKMNILPGLQRPVRMGNLLEVINAYPIHDHTNATMFASVRPALESGKTVGRGISGDSGISFDKVEFSRNIPHIYEIKALHWYPS